MEFRLVPEGSVVLAGKERHKRELNCLSSATPLFFATLPMVHLLSRLQHMSNGFENIASSDNSLYTALGTVFCKSLCSKAAQGFTNNFNSNTPDLIAQRPSLTYLSIPASPKAGDYVIRLPFRKRLARAVLI